MKYLILTADYTSFLRDEFDEDFEYLNLNLSPDLIERLEEWHDDYLPIIQLNSDDRLKISNEIIKLDERGIGLAKEIKLQVEEVKVKYFSEGLLKYIEC
ncbi:hypothetical protein [Chitinophaga sp. CF418]|uniref:hypothetical protein n=1 Tax=Chitinophaga sp. CF418 TaxID=1855287 RepID=UPI0009146698|nr:hypothetical protein [Chitinophaga sp. CF418]SHN07886.1 hypothetical protein SAMN05216311_10549 [Chitinophaga sp. CF418]